MNKRKKILWLITLLGIVVLRCNYNIDEDINIEKVSDIITSNNKILYIESNVDELKKVRTTDIMCYDISHNINIRLLSDGVFNEFPIWYKGNVLFSSSRQDYLMPRFEHDLNKNLYLLDLAHNQVTEFSLNDNIKRLYRENFIAHHNGLTLSKDDSLLFFANDNEIYEIDLVDSKYKKYEIDFVDWTIDDLSVSQECDYIAFTYTNHDSINIFIHGFAIYDIKMSSTVCKIDSFKSPVDLGGWGSNNKVLYFHDQLHKLSTNGCQKEEIFIPGLGNEFLISNFHYIQENTIVMFAHKIIYVERFAQFRADGDVSILLYNEKTQDMKAIYEDALYKEQMDVYYNK